MEWAQENSLGHHTKTEYKIPQLGYFLGIIMCLPLAYHSMRMNELKIILPAASSFEQQRSGKVAPTGRNKTPSCSGRGSF